MNGNLSSEQMTKLSKYGVNPAGMHSYGVQGGLDHFSSVSEHPLSSSSSTNSSFGRRTAWTTKSAGHGPIAFSSNTKGTTINFDNPMSTPRVQW